SSSTTVTTAAPAVTINGFPAGGVEGTGIHLTSTVSDPGGPVGAFTYAWTATKNGYRFATGTDSTFDFTPDDNGIYSVSLTVTATDGARGSTTGVIDLVAGDYSTLAVRRYSGLNGGFLGTVSSGLTGLSDQGTVVGPDGKLYVTGFGQSTILRCDPYTGQPLPSAGNGGATFIAAGVGGLN